MNRSSLKSGIFLITYGIVLYLVLSHIGLVAGAGSYIMTVLRPVIIGVVMAYVINLLMRPMETKWLAGLWRRCPRLARGKRGLCIVPFHPGCAGHHYGPVPVHPAAGRGKPAEPCQ